MKLTGKEFAKILAERHECTIKEANYFIEDFIDVLIETIENNNEVGFQKFGIFKKVNRKEKKGIHPVTKNKITRKAYSTIVFKSSNLNKIIVDEVDEKDTNESMEN